MTFYFTAPGFEGRTLSIEMTGVFSTPRIAMDGQPAAAGPKKNEFLLTRNDGKVVVARFQATQLGAMWQVVVDGLPIPLTDPLTWYEWLWVGAPFALVFVGGALGGLLGGLGLGVNLWLFRGQESPGRRYALTGLVTAGIWIGFVVAAVFIHSTISGVGDLASRGSPPADSKSPSPVSAPQPAAPRANGPAREIVLPADAPKLKEMGTVRFIGKSHETLRVTATAPKENLRIRIPAGTIFQPLDPNGPNGPAVAWVDQEVSLNASAHSQDGWIRVVNGNAARWNYPRETDLYQADSTETNSRLLEFFKLAVQRKASWAVVQVGTWVLLNNVSAEEFNKNRVATNVYDLDSGRFIYVPITGYQGIKEARLLFEELKWDPREFRLFEQKRTQLEKALKETDFENPGLNWRSMLTNRALEEYAGEPEVEALLLKYATAHSELGVREDAMRSLGRIGLSGEADAQVRQMLQDGAREKRFLYAMSLVRKGDLRGQPVLAFYGDDPSLGKLVPYLRKAIQDQSKVAPQEGETLIAYWERAVGWENLKKQYGDVEAIRKLTQDRAAARDPWLDEYLGRIKSAQGKEVSSMINELERRYPDNEPAFQAIREVAMTHADKNVRVQAGRCLISHYGRFDIKGFVAEVLEKEAEGYVAGDLLRHAVAFGKFEGRDRLVAQGLAHRLPEVRARTVEILNQDRASLTKEQLEALLGESQLTQLAEGDSEKRVRLLTVSHLLGSRSALAREKADAILLRVAEKETDPTVRRAAFSTLAEVKCRAVLPLLKKQLQNGDKAEKGEAIGQLDRWGTDPEALDILELAREDPDVGTYAKNVLKRRGR